MSYKNKLLYISIVLLFITAIILNSNVNSVNYNSKNINADSSTTISKDNLEISDDFLPPPSGSNASFYWDFPNGTIKAFYWSMKSDSEYRSSFSYYNITSMPYVFNASGNDCWEYGVQLQEVYYNTTKKSHLPNPYNPEPIYTSLVNFSIPYFFPTKPPEEDEDPGTSIIFMINAFIPTNGTNGLALNWSATMLASFYSQFFQAGFDQISVNEITRNIFLINYTNNGFVNLTYNSDGILKEGILNFFDIEAGKFRMLTVKVDDDINPVDEVDWNINVGEILYYGIGRNEYRFNITDIVNETISIPQMGALLNAETVWANMSIWNPYMETWSTEMEFRIGSANEIMPYLPFAQPILPIVVPNNTNMEILKDMFLMTQEEAYNYQAESGLEGIYLYNETSSLWWNYTQKGLTKFAKLDNMGEFLMGESTAGIYRKNTTLVQTFKSIEFKNIGKDNFNITLNISVIADTTLFYSTFTMNPVNISQVYGCIFMDIMVNVSANLNQNSYSPINISIQYNHIKYTNMKVFYFNTSANGGIGAWELIPFKDNGMGLITFTVNHTSIFAISNFPLDKPLSILNGDDDDDDDNPAIPFGHYYLIFIAMAIIGIIIYRKHELFKK